ncbi:neutral zinc metallopeptidase [Cellulomonas sp. SLBN-39]|uniref:KPN_02809 family neutral zinc metallopeptidase n=1 Tax=Cellulomonas sp. SLBN-39 TaxID=2768446 RepID=UPI001151A3D9|nr:neutral zinc metallopeptidase [Cellulomonas sp. SLBN-39]
MTFSDGGNFEGGRVSRRSGGRTAAVGGGAIGLVVLAVYLFTGTDLSPLLGGGEAGAPAAQETVGACSAEQANSDPTCRFSATVQSLDAYWEPTLAGTGTPLTLPEGAVFEQATSTGCGDASASTGPFYCPVDTTIYLDLGFFTLLQEQFGTQGGPLAEMYVYAHEYGHHVQHLTGALESADRTGTGADSDSVRIELQADCYAGMWAGDAATREDPDTGVTFLEPITAEQLAQAIDTAEAIGDDHIQAGGGGTVDPDTWTHGSSEQRRRWFTIGYEQGSMQACDTFAAADL